MSYVFWILVQWIRIARFQHIYFWDCPQNGQEKFCLSSFRAEISNLSFLSFHLLKEMSAIINAILETIFLHSCQSFLCLNNTVILRHLHYIWRHRARGLPFKSIRGCHWEKKKECPVLNWYIFQRSERFSFATPTFESSAKSRETHGWQSEEYANEHWPSLKSSLAVVAEKSLTAMAQTRPPRR